MLTAADVIICITRAIVSAFVHLMIFTRSSFPLIVWLLTGLNDFSTFDIFR